MPQINGYLGTISRDVELRTSAKGMSVLSFSIANKEGFGDNERTDFIPCVAFGKTAELISKYFKKGDPILLSGKWQNSPYQKNDKGYDIPNWQYVVQGITFLPKPKNSAPPTFAAVNENNMGYGGGSADGFELINADSGDLPF